MPIKWGEGETGAVETGSKAPQANPIGLDGVCGRRRHAVDGLVEIIEGGAVSRNRKGWQKA